MTAVLEAAAEADSSSCAGVSMPNDGVGRPFDERKSSYWMVRSWIMEASSTILLVGLIFLSKVISCVMFEAAQVLQTIMETGPNVK